MKILKIKKNIETYIVFVAMVINIAVTLLHIYNSQGIKFLMEFVSIDDGIHCI